jgi:putative DNA primase/helicase
MHSNDRKHDDLTPDTIERALNFISPVDRKRWLKMAMAIKSELGEAGFDIWDRWSATDGDGYNAKSAKHVWKSVKIGGKVGIASLILEALEGGFRFDNDNYKRLNDEEYAQRQAERDERIKQAAAEERERQTAAAAIAAEIWNSAVSANDHPYAGRKGVGIHGLRVGKWPLRNSEGAIYAHAENCLLIPLRNASNKITTLQCIFDVPPTGYETDKSFLKDGRKSGSHFKIGTLPVSGKLAFCEGYATGATIHELTGWCVIVCFDRTNLKTVAEQFRNNLPDLEFVICADNDRHTKGNPGVTNAQEAAQAVRGRMIAPQFTGEQGTDFNDLAAIEGADIVRSQLGYSSAPVVMAANDNTDVEPIPIASVDIYTPFPEMTKKGPLQTIRNYDEMLKRLNTTVRYNIIAKKIEVLIPGASYTIDNEENACIAVLESWAERFGIGSGRLTGSMLTIAERNLYNPVAQWILSKPWDGVKRLQQFYNTVTPAHEIRVPSGEALKDVLIRRWMLSALAGVFQPSGVSAHGVLTFVGGQYLGKTAWFKSLAPAHLDVIQDGLLLNPSDKDSVMQCVSNWLVELGELDATFRKADIAQLKSFITKVRDTLRRPYARGESSFARRTVFFASVNDTQFLHDPTGNRRFWTIECKHLDFSHEIDMQQVWAEMFLIYQDGERNHKPGTPQQWTLNAEEMAALNDTNRDYEAVNPVHDLIDGAYDWQADRAIWTSPMSATEIVLGAKMDRPNKADANAAAAYVVKQYNVVVKRAGPERTRKWMMPPKLRGIHRADDESAPF